MPLDTDTLPPGDRGVASSDAARASSIVTRMVFSASPERTWKSLLFYEEVEERPPLHLRLLLPVPIRTEGDKTKLGAEARCLYHGGHLVKRPTRIEAPSLYEFQVAQQALAVGGTMRLSGGRYTLSALGEDRTEVSIETRYTSNKWPRWFWGPLERFVCHAFHRFLLRTMRRKAELS